MALVPGCGGEDTTEPFYEPPAARTVTLEDGSVTCARWIELVEQAGADPLTTLQMEFLDEGYEEVRIDPFTPAPGEWSHHTASVRGADRESILVMVRRFGADATALAPTLAVADYLAARTAAERPPRSTVRFSILPDPADTDVREVLADYFRQRPLSLHGIEAVLVVESGPEESLATNRAELEAVLGEAERDLGIGADDGDGERDGVGPGAEPGELFSALAEARVPTLRVVVDVADRLERCSTADGPRLRRAADVLLTVTEKLDAALAFARDRRPADEAPSTDDVAS